MYIYVYPSLYNHYIPKIPGLSTVINPHEPPVLAAAEVAEGRPEPGLDEGERRPAAWLRWAELGMLVGGDDGQVDHFTKY